MLGPNATEENIKYCSEPYIQLISRYSVLVDESRVEIDGLNQVLEEHNMDIAKLSKENEKYVQLAGVGAAKRTWTQYEELLGLERIVNRKFLSMLAEASQANYEKKKPRVTPSYRDYLLANSNFTSNITQDFTLVSCFI